MTDRPQISRHSPQADLVPVVLVAAADQKFATQLMVSLHSALARLDRKRRAQVYVIDGGISAEEIARIESCLGRAHPSVSITVLTPDTSGLAELHVTGRFTTAIYLRLLIERLLPKSVEKVLYLDSDIVVTDDVSSLFDLDLAGKAIWAVQEAGDITKRLVNDFPEENVPEGMPYFNSGVLLIDLPEWRRQHISERAFELLNRYGERLQRWGDQDALNMAIAGNWGSLPQRWNNIISGQTYRFPDLWSKGHSPGVLHFVGRRKPWHPGYSCRMKHRYLYALASTHWFGWQRRLTLWLEASFWAVYDRLRFAVGRKAVRGGQKRRPART